MKVYIGADHRGFELKEELKDFLMNEYEVEDLGNLALDPKDDYPDFAASVARCVAEDKEARGIVICGSGAGVDIVANKFDGVRAVLAGSPEEIRSAREDDNVNVLALASDFTGEEEARIISQTFLETKFKNEERHARRLDKIADIERSN